MKKILQALKSFFGVSDADTVSVSVSVKTRWTGYKKEPIKMKWKYFSEDEVEGLVDDLVFKLDRAREFFEAPIIITSGYRDPEKNESVGGVSNSAHVKGLAVDIRCADPELQKKLVWALGFAGIGRVITYSGHVHADVDKEKRWPYFGFGGESK